MVSGSICSSNAQSRRATARFLISLCTRLQDEWRDARSNHDFVGLRKDTALLDVIGALDAFDQAKIITSNNFNLSMATVVAFIFIVITSAGAPGWRQSPSSQRPDRPEWTPAQFLSQRDRGLLLFDRHQFFRRPRHGKAGSADRIGHDLRYFRSAFQTA